MNATQTTPAPELTTKAPKGKSLKLNSKPASKIDEQKQQVAAQLEELQRQQLELFQQEEAERLTRNTELKAQYDELLADARDYRDLAKNANDPDKQRQFFSEARSCEQAAASIAAELGLNVPAPEVEKSPWYTKNHSVIAALQVIGVIAAMWLLKWYFQEFRLDILEQNAKLPAEQQMSPYDDSSLQKLVFEKLALFTDLPFALIVLTLIVPFVGFYLLPFLKARKDFHTEFYEELTPWQRACITTCFVLGLLLFFALSHQVKP